MQPIQYSALEKVSVLRPVDRLEFLQDQAAGKFVFDLGALDETAYKAKQTSETWLHARLCRSAKAVVGLDNSDLIPDTGLTTASNGRIIRANIFDLQATIDECGRPDIIVAGELVEHLPDTNAFLHSLRSCNALKGVEVIVTTPNACCWHNFLIGLAGRESMHKDHLQIYSYKTLRTIFERNGFQVQLLRPYFARFPEMIETDRAAISIAARGFQKTVNALEFAAPILSAGWIVKTTV